MRHRGPPPTLVRSLMGFPFMQPADVFPAARPRCGGTLVRAGIAALALTFAVPVLPVFPAIAQARSAPESFADLAAKLLLILIEKFCCLFRIVLTKEPHVSPIFDDFYT